MSEEARETNFYVDPVILTSEPEASSWVDHRPDWRKQHIIWEHANETISKPSPSEQDLSSAIIQLQRSVEHRDKLLDQLYAFEKIPGRKPGSKYETMADLKIIRPTLKARLRDLRNRLIHEFGDIPLKASDCEELCDTAWYYLKATDHLAQQCVSDFDLRFPADQADYSLLQIEFSRSDWTAWVNASLSGSLLLDAPSETSLIIRAAKSRITTTTASVRFTGTVTGSPSAQNRLVQMFFEESALR